MPNRVKMTTAKNSSQSAHAFRYYASELNGTMTGTSNAVLKVWSKNMKLAEKAENKATHLGKHKGVGRKARRVGLKRKGA